MDYLGLVVEPEKFSADAKNVKTIQEWPEEPLTRLLVRGFLGLVGYFRMLSRTFPGKHTHCFSC